VELSIAVVGTTAGVILTEVVDISIEDGEVIVVGLCEESTVVAVSLTVLAVSGVDAVTVSTDVVDGSTADDVDIESDVTVKVSDKFVGDDDFTVVVVGYSDVVVDFCGVVLAIGNVDMDIAALVAVVCSSTFVVRRGFVDVAIDIAVSVVAVLKKGLVSITDCDCVVSKALVVELCAAVVDLFTAVDDTGCDDV
jgi:hypothetical protein